MSAVTLPAPHTARAALAGLAAIALLTPLLATAFAPYGLFIDEFYYVACSRHLAFGYVDHPPLAVLLLRASRALLGDSAVALRVLPALCAAATVLMTGLLARRLGAGPWAQALAALCVAVSPGLLAFFGFFSVNAFEVPIWLGAFWLLIELELRDQPRLWLALGLLAGIGLENKHTFVLWAVAAAGGLLLTPARRHLKTPWPWLAALVALLLLLPNLVWQAQHAWPSLEFYRNASLHKNLPAAPHAILILQAFFAGLGALPLCLAAFALFFPRRKPKPLAHLGWAYLVLLALLVASRQSRPDRIAGAYPLLFAAGAVVIERAAQRRRWLLFALPSGVTLLAAPLLPLVVPLLPPPALARYTRALGGAPQVESGAGKASALPQLLADRLGWEQLVRDVGAAVARLTPPERATCAIFAPSYGHAGALELLGRDLPPVYSGHNNYFLWGPPRPEPRVAIVLGGDAARLRELFEEVELSAIHDCELCMPWRDQLPIWVGRRPRRPIAEVWPSQKHYE